MSNSAARDDLSAAWSGGVKRTMDSITGILDRAQQKCTQAAEHFKSREFKQKFQEYVMGGGVLTSVIGMVGTAIGAVIQSPEVSSQTIIAVSGITTAVGMFTAIMAGSVDVEPVYRYKSRPMATHTPSRS